MPRLEDARRALKDHEAELRSKLEVPEGEDWQAYLPETGVGDRMFAKWQKHVDDLEAKLNRLSLKGSSDPTERKAELKAKVESWARAVVGANLVGVPNLSADQQKALADVAAEYKALGIANDTTGGYLAPAEYIREIIKGVTDVSPVRSLARVRQTASKAIMIPKRTGQFAAQWVADQGTKTETDGLRYGMWEIPTHEMYALIDISNQNLEDSAFNMESEISFEATEQFAVAEGAAFVSGNAVGRPEGILVASGVGGNNSGSATTIADADGQANGLLTMKYSLKSSYARNANWIMNRTTLGSVRKLKDAQKGYIWTPGIALGAPNTIDGDPYVEVPDKDACSQCRGNTASDQKIKNNINNLPTEMPEFAVFHVASMLQSAR